MDLSKKVKSKTKKLISIKSEYSSLVQEIDKEFSLKKQIIEDMTIHFPLTLAKQCLSLLQKDPPDIATVINLLKQLKQQEMQSDSSYEYDYDEINENKQTNEQQYQEKIVNSKKEQNPINDDYSYSSSDSLDGSFHLDDEKFFGQFNQNSDPLLDD